MADSPNPIQSKGFLSSSKVLDSGRGAAISPSRTFPLDIHSKKKSYLSNTHTQWVHQLQGTFSNRKKKNGWHVKYWFWHLTRQTLQDCLYWDKDINHSLILISLKRVVMHYAHFCCCFHSFSLFRVSSFIIFEINGVSALLRAS